ncbi:MBL fold metallo-hydrolase [Serpentinicella alkaliphila]|uniref:Metallo-beta-lactamase superfamily protein n=1 Tax=Serpentinicella alkaliphila TaxID=1734049 RepID=A0A4V2T4Y2_9FIRM|nr:MBL fold metallo-hydrolase [Serpentinicella alkaliphila]QUH25215.1 MBL fold metallo-hydrolase [Serpentinicella alkaliphila]TCQ07024.1 hypothetical protein EDD79_100220 [Serpentinicella alkaliphila]
MKVQFGGHVIEIIPYPGHSICTSIVKINDEYIHVADELMFSNKGEPILPCMTKEDVRRQWESIIQLERISQIYFYTHNGKSLIRVNDKKFENRNILFTSSKIYA